MKKLLLISVIACMAALSTYAEDAPDAPNQAATFDIFGVFVNYYGGSYELGLGDKFSVKLDLGVSPNLIWFTNLGLFNGKGEVRYYFDHALNGWYLGAAGIVTTLFGGYTDASGDVFTYSGFLPGAGAYLGYKWLWGKGNTVFLDASLGYEVYAGTVSVAEKDSLGNSVSASGTIPTVGGLAGGLDIGYAW